MLLSFGFPSLGFPPKPSRLRSADASIIISFSAAAFCFAALSFAGFPAPSSPLAFPLPSPLWVEPPPP